MKIMMIIGVIREGVRGVASATPYFDWIRGFFLKNELATPVTFFKIIEKI